MNRFSNAGQIDIGYGLLQKVILLQTHVACSPKQAPHGVQRNLGIIIEDHTIHE